MNEILEKMRKEDRLLSESAVMKAVQKALIEMGYEPLGDEVQKVFEAIDNVKELAEEHNNGWIPCSERLPEYTDDYNVTVLVASELGSYEKATTLRFEKIKGKEPKWIIPQNEVLIVLAWQPLPAHYQPKGE